MRVKTSAASRLTAAAIAITLLGACGGAAGSASLAPHHSSRSDVRRNDAQVATSAASTDPHVAVIVMENKEYGTVIGSPSAPFINALARRYALATKMYAVTHPSLPNYLALTGGSTFGINSDCTGCRVHARSIVNQLERAHISWTAYMEGLPYPCFRGASSGEYAKKHDPFAYYASITGNAAWCAHIVSLARLGADERSGALPRFIWISPDLCHDMHDCSVATGDRFLSKLVPPLLRSLGPNGLLILTWDEGSTDAGCCRLAAGGHVATIIAGPGARPGARLRSPTDHYSVLQTVEDVLGLPRLRGAACTCTRSLKPLLAGS